MVRADVTTPMVLQEACAGPPSPQSLPLNVPTRNMLATMTKYRADLVRAAFTAEETFLGYACRQGDIDQVLARSAALVECMGARIASTVASADRSHVVDTAKEVALPIRAAKTQMVL